MIFSTNIVLWCTVALVIRKIKMWNVDVRTTDDRRRTKSDDNSSHGLKARWAKKSAVNVVDGRQAKTRKKEDEILIVHCCFSVSQNELKF
jgi:hypothetical protein